MKDLSVNLSHAKDSKGDEWRPLHQAIFNKEHDKVAGMLLAGTNWRESLLLHPESAKSPRGKRRFHNNMNALDVAVLSHQIKSVAMILKLARSAKDEHLVKKAYGRINDSQAEMLKAFHTAYPEILFNEFREALESCDINKLIQLAKDRLLNDFDKLKDQHGNHILHVIAKSGTKANLEEILKLKTSVLRLVNLPNAIGNTPLHIATSINNQEMINTLLDHGALVGKHNLQGDTSLHIAVTHTNATTVERLCIAGYLQNRHSEVHQVTFDIEAKNKQGRTANMLSKSLPVIRALIDQSSYRRIQKGIALIYQAQQTDLKIFISENPYVLAEVDDQGNTLLHHAIIAYKQTDKSCIIEILNAKPNVNIKNKEGLTPLLLAASLGVWYVPTESTTEMLFLLLRRSNVNISEKDNRGLTILHYAAMQSIPWNVIYYIFLVSDIYIDTVTPSGLAPIHLAAFYGNYQVFNSLLTKKADIHIAAYPHALSELYDNANQTTQEITPLFIALNANAKEIVDAYLYELIQSNNTAILRNVRSLDGSTLLHHYAKNNDLYRFKKALLIGVDPFVTNNANYSPFHYACAVGAIEIVKHYIEELAPAQSYWSQLKGGTFDINVLPEKGVNALSLSTNHGDVSQYLKSKGARIARVDAERTKGKLETILEFHQTQSAFRGELESTSIYQVLNVGRMVGSTMLSAYKGTVGMGVAAAHQLLLYGMPAIIKKSSELYYAAKPIVHNHAPRMFESGLDATATVTSNLAHSLLTAVDILDIASNPARRFAGYATSMGMANLASRYTDNRSVQGVAYFLGREIGMFAVDAYQNYNRQNGDAARNQALSQAYDLWTSAIGEEYGNRLVATINQYSQMHQSMLDSVGWFEHTVLSYVGASIDSMRDTLRVVGLASLDEKISKALSMSIAQPLAFMSSFQDYSRTIFQLREQVLTKIEHYIAENVLPDSLHRNVTLQFLALNQTVLLTQKLLAKKDEQTVQRDMVHVLEEELQVLNDSAVTEKSQLQVRIENAKNVLQVIDQECESLTAKVTESQSTYDELWKKTPKGALEFQCREAQQNHFDEQLKIESLKLKIQYLKDYKADEATITEVGNQLQQAEKSLIDLQTALEASEKDWLELANPVERKQLPQQREAMSKRIEEQLSAFREEQSKVFDLQYQFLSAQNELVEIWMNLKNTELKVVNAKNAFDIIDLQIKAIDNPPYFRADETVHNALDQYPTDCNQAVNLILEKVVATGMISSSDATERMRSSLFAAFNSFSHKSSRLIKVLSHHCALLSKDYRVSLIQQREQLQKAMTSAINEYSIFKDEYVAQESIFLQSKLDYETKAGLNVEDTINPVLRQPNNWDSVHYAEDIRVTLTLLGQSQMTINAMIDNGGPTSQWHKATFLAKSLIDYKYLFIAAPSIDVRLQEIDALAVELVKQTLDFDRIADLKRNMDLQIAQQLQGNVISFTPQLQASTISNQLQNGFRYRNDQTFHFESDESSLTQTLAMQFEAKDEPSATQSIVKVLQDQTNAISIAEVGEYTSPVVVPHVPSSSHGLNRWWDNSKKYVLQYGKKILAITGGVTTSVDTSGLSGGFTYGNQFRIVNFSKSIPEPVFTIPERTRTPIDINRSSPVAAPEKALEQPYVPFPERVITDIPHVVTMPWESVSQSSLQPLMFSAQAQAAAQPVTVANTALTTAKSGPRGKVAPSLSASLTVSLRTKPAPISFDEIFISPLAVYKDMTLIPELEEAMLAREPCEVMLSVQPSSQTTIADKLLNLVVSDAEAAVPLVIGAAMTASAVGAMGVALMQPHQDDEQNLAGNDEHFRERGLLPYFGSDPSIGQAQVNPVVFPGVSSSSTKTETLVNQPGASALVLTTPYFALKTFQNVYYMANGKDNSGIYDHDYPKHQRAPGGGAMWGNGVSINPIPNAEIGQKLLDTAYTTPDRPNQKFNYYEGKVIKFRTSNDGRWHSYEIDNNFIDNVGDDILKQFVNTNLLSDKQYRKLVKK